MERKEKRRFGRVVGWRSVQKQYSSNNISPGRRASGFVPFYFGCLAHTPSSTCQLIKNDDPLSGTNTGHFDVFPLPAYKFTTNQDQQAEYRM